ncbi:MAG: NYN domain-containing protein [Firmicutes bacterium]|nr:NYN domain-containing protein [Bacillota bacterium]
MTNSENNIALFIDADNIASKYVKNIFDELTNIGTISVRRIYGNWKKNNGWSEEILLEYSITPVQQFDYVKGKNATDITMVIEAMDILYNNSADIFCIVTSDSDFTRLAIRLREANKKVVGMGESKTPASFVRSCNKFIHVDLISETRDDNSSESVTSIENIKQAILNMFTSDNNKISLGEIGNTLNRLFPDFDTRNYGYSKLSVFVSEKMSDKLTIKQEGNNYTAVLEDSVNVEDIVRDIKEYIASHNYRVSPLQKIDIFIKGKYPSFNSKSLGYSQLSSFLKSIPSLSVNANTVTMERDKSRKKAEKATPQKERTTKAKDKGSKDTVNKEDIRLKALTILSQNPESVKLSKLYEQISALNIKVGYRKFVDILRGTDEIGINKDDVLIIDKNLSEKEALKKAVKDYIINNGGQVKNTGAISRYLKSELKTDYKKFGYKAMKDLIKEIDGVETVFRGAKIVSNKE